MKLNVCLLKQHLSVSPVIHLPHVKLGDFLVRQPQKDVLNVLKSFPLQILVRNQIMEDLIDLLGKLKPMMGIVLQL